MIIIRAKVKDLKKINISLNNQVIISVLLNNLNRKFKEFIYYIIISLTKEPDFEEIITILYKEERLSKRDQTISTLAA